MRKSWLVTIIAFGLSVSLTACQEVNVPVDKTTEASVGTEASFEGMETTEEGSLRPGESTDAPETEEVQESETETGTGEDDVQGEQEIPQHTTELVAAGDDVVQRISTGQTVLVDLDGDGTDEKLMVVMEEEWFSGNSRPFLNPAILINEHYFTKEMFREMYAENPYEDHFYLIDLDVSDQWIEIALLSSGPSIDPQTHFYRYQDGELICIGSVPDALYVAEDGTMSAAILGDGKYTGKAEVYIVENAWAILTWKLTNAESFEAMIEWEMPEYYDYINRRAHALEVIREFPIYNEKVENTENISYLPVGTSFDFICYYPKEGWLGFCYGDEGEIGWIKVINHDNGSKIILPANINKTNGLHEYISGLVNAD